MVYKGRSNLIWMIWGYLHLRKPSYILRCGARKIANLVYNLRIAVLCPDHSATNMHQRKSKCKLRRESKTRYESNNLCSLILEHPPNSKHGDLFLYIFIIRGYLILEKLNLKKCFFPDFKAN